MRRVPRSKRQVPLMLQGRKADWSVSKNNAPPLKDPEGVARVYAQLLARAPENKVEPRMNAMQRAMDVLGDPQKAAPVIHITGTNGKTSTARMIESLLLAHDIRTGRFTSPHLVSVTERIVIDGKPVADTTLVRIWDEIQPYLEIVDTELREQGENPITFFEAVTILAFAVFADEPVEVVVLEVGLGGAWDATNVADGQVAVITPIDLDHTDLLGDTLEDIASEKAGIIKQDAIVVSSVQQPEAAQVLLDAAKEKGAQWRFEGVEFGTTERQLAVGGQMLTIQGLADRYPDVAVPLHGEHQAQNASVALAAVEAFLGGGDKPLNIDVVRAGFEAAESPGRLETVRTSPTFILDAAHNPAGVSVTAKALKEAFGFSRLVLVLGVLQEKDALGMLIRWREELGDLVHDVAITQSDSPRSIPAGDLAAMAVDAGFDEEDLFITESVPDALDWAAAKADEAEDMGGGVLVTGSITLIGQARALLNPKKEV